MSNLKVANTLFRKGIFGFAGELYREILSAQPDFKSVEFNLKLCERNNVEGYFFHTPFSSSKVGVDEIPTITFTTIKARLHAAMKVIESLHNQTVLPKKILLFVSREPYLLDQGISVDDIADCKIDRFPLLEIRWVKNTGPYRKIIPFVAEAAMVKPFKEMLFITVDDDTLYPSTFVGDLIQAHRQFNCVVAFRGRAIKLSESGGVSPYGQWPAGSAIPSYANIPTGKDGVIYSTRYFSPAFLAEDLFLATAPTADDLWIKWNTSFAGVKSVVLNPEACESDYKSFPLVDYSKEARACSLYAAHNAVPGKSRNDDAVEKLEELFKGRLQTGLGSVMASLA